MAVQPEMTAPLYKHRSDLCREAGCDHAFEWLGKRRLRGKIDMTQAEAAPELAPLRSDPRFAAILPKASDFADPSWNR